MGRILFTPHRSQLFTANFGLLYNWAAAMDLRGIANTGWRIPTDSDWNTLSTYLGGNAVSGGHLKELNIAAWNDTFADNSSNFNARGGGERNEDGAYRLLKDSHRIWSSTNNYVSEGAFQTNYALLKSADTTFSIVSESGAGGGYNMGNGIRLVKASTTLSNGQTGIYIGNDGKKYRTICIGTQEWLADNLCETKYNKDYLFNYGYLYNWWAVNDVKKITSSDTWIVPSYSDWTTFRTYIGGSTSGNKLREVGTDHWLTNNAGATNEYGFNVLGTGVRDYSAAGSGFARIKIDCYFHCSTSYPGEPATTYYLYVTGATFGATATRKSNGASARIYRLATTEEQLLPDGTPCAEYVGNDGKVYPTVKISDKVWLAWNLIETKFRDNSLIPFAGVNGINYSNAEWGALTTSGLCSYRDSPNNAVLDGKNIDMVTDNTEWNALWFHTGALCAYDNDWNNV